MEGKTCEEIILNFTLEEFKEKLRELDDIKVNLGAKIILTYHKLAFDYHPDFVNSPGRSSKAKDEIIAKGMPLVKSLFERIGFFNEETFHVPTKTSQQIQYLKIISPDYLKFNTQLERPCSSTIAEREITPYNGDGSGVAIDDGIDDDRYSEEEEIQFEIDEYTVDESVFTQSNGENSSARLEYDNSSNSLRLSSLSRVRRPRKITPKKADLSGQRFSRQLIETELNTYQLDLSQEIPEDDELVRVIKVEDKVFKHQIFFYPKDDKLFDVTFVRQWFLKAISAKMQTDLCAQFIKKKDNGTFRCLICADCPYHIGKPGHIGPVRKHVSNLLFIFPCPFLSCKRFEKPFDTFSTMDKHLRSFKHKKM